MADWREFSFRDGASIQIRRDAVTAYSPHSVYPTTETRISLNGEVLTIAIPFKEFHQWVTQPTKQTPAELVKELKDNSRRTRR